MKPICIWEYTLRSIASVKQIECFGLNDVMFEAASLSFSLIQNEQYIPVQVCSDTQGASEWQYRVLSDRATNILELKKNIL